MKRTSGPPKEIVPLFRRGYVAAQNAPACCRMFRRSRTGLAAEAPCRRECLRLEVLDKVACARELGYQVLYRTWPNERCVATDFTPLSGPLVSPLSLSLASLLLLMEKTMRSCPRFAEPPPAAKQTAPPPRPNRELSVDLLITFLHMNDEGVVTIHGVDGTPGADWCVTIAGSDSNGGEYVFTEHQRDLSLPTHANGPDAPATEPRGEQDHATGRGGGGREKGPIRGAEEADEERATRPGTMLRHEVMTELMSIRMGENDGELSSEDDDNGADDEEKPWNKGAWRGGGREGGTSRKTDGDGNVDALLTSPGGEEADRRRRSSHDGGAESTRPPFHTPTPPAKKSNSFSSGEEHGNPSPVQRFAKWIVRNAHIGSGKKRSGGGGGGAGDNTAAQDRGTGPLSPHKLDKGGGGGGGGGASTTQGSGVMSPPGSPRFKPREGILPHVRGFVPKREVEVSMTCPLPSKLPFQPDQTEEEFDAPTFGTTVLGNSHGFDPKG